MGQGSLRAGCHEYRDRLPVGRNYFANLRYLGRLRLVSLYLSIRILVFDNCSDFPSNASHHISIRLFARVFQLEYMGLFTYRYRGFGGDQSTVHAVDVAFVL